MKLTARALLAAAFLGGAATNAAADPATAAEQGHKAAYANGLPTDPSYFPIGVWLQSPRLAPEYRAIGVNLFVGLYKGPTEDQLAELARYGMPVIASQNRVGLTSPNAKMIRGWMQADEPDNAHSSMWGFWRSCIPASEVAMRSLAIKAKDPTRPVMITFGRGVADPSWRGRGWCTGDMAYYDKAAVGADILSFDIYPVASDTLALAGQLDAPARGVKRLRAAARNGQRVWAFIETTHINSLRSRVTPDQLRSEALLALIRGADGLVYFAHEWTGGFREDGLFRYPEIVQAVKDTNAFVRLLAPVLNSPTIEGRITLSGTVPIATTLKQYDGELYLFAGSTAAKTGAVTFSIEGASNGRVEALDEERRLRLSNGEFSDAFDKGYQVHVYRISADDRP
jgi:hypothetical protein